jgi:hypothetical protein
MVWTEAHPYQFMAHNMFIWGLHRWAYTLRKNIPKIRLIPN